MTKKAQIHTRVVLVPDLSGSMQGPLEAKQREMLQEYVDKLKAVEEFGQQTFEVTILKFSKIVARSQTSNTASAFPRYEIQACETRAMGMGSQTALRDAIGAALDMAMVDDVPTLIQVFTDGDENASYQWTPHRLQAAIEKAEGTGRVTVAMAGPPNAINFLSRIGIPAGNFRAWDGSVKEQAEVRVATLDSVELYTQERAKGVRSTNKFYADPTNLTASGVRGFTKEVQPAEVKAVTKRMDGRSIADFYGGKFKAGNHFYELIKPEYLQEDKELVVHIKKDAAGKPVNEYRVGSRSVRALLGLPEIGKIRVHPGPHSEAFTLFVQSSSVNRKLVEGQKMLSLE